MSEISDLIYDSVGDESFNILANDDIGNQIMAGFGLDPDNFQSSECLLVSLLIDDSGSIESAGNTQAIIDGHNSIIAEFKNAKNANDILVHTRYINGNILYPYSSLDDVIMMTNRNYCPSGYTPLYDQSIIFLGTILSKSQQFEQDYAIPTRTISLILTDGADVGSIKHDSDVKLIMSDILKLENHIISGIGVDDHSTNFKKVFSNMGILPKFIKTIGDDPKEIRRELGLWSKSAIRASQTAANFSAAAAGGFTI